MWVPGGIVDQCSLRKFFVRKEEEKRGRRGEKASDEGERVEIVVPPRSEEMFVLWTARAFSWCRPLLRSCCGC